MDGNDSVDGLKEKDVAKLRKENAQLVVLQQQANTNLLKRFKGNAEKISQFAESELMKLSASTKEENQHRLQPPRQKRPVSEKQTSSPDEPDLMEVDSLLSSESERDQGIEDVDEVVKKIKKPVSQCNRPQGCPPSKPLTDSDEESDKDIYDPHGPSTSGSLPTGRQPQALENIVSFFEFC